MEPEEIRRKQENKIYNISPCTAKLEIRNISLEGKDGEDGSQNNQTITDKIKVKQV